MSTTVILRRAVMVVDLDFPTLVAHYADAHPSITLPDRPWDGEPCPL